ncbi:MAG: hypothetical protein ACOWYE_04965 [Desulfatiglandales bacterium]
MGPGWGYRIPYGRLQEPLEKDDAKELVEDYLKSTRNPNLKVGEVEDHGPGFEVAIVTKDGSPVDKVLVDKETGRMDSIYRFDWKRGGVSQKRPVRELRNVRKGA